MLFCISRHLEEYFPSGIPYDLEDTDNSEYILINKVRAKDLESNKYELTFAQVHHWAITNGKQLSKENAKKYPELKKFNNNCKRLEER